jgi:hypothetical protein
LKKLLLDAAEILDAWRVFPRVYLGFFLLVLWDLHSWYIGVAVNPDIYANLVFGVVGTVFGLYMNSGRNWDR